MTPNANPSQTTRKRQSVTLKEVAQRAGVGVMTASRALNKPHMVSDELRDRVAQAVQELRYIPDRVAGHLAGGTSEIIPFLIPTLNHNIYVPTLNALTDDLSRAGYQLLLSTTEYDLAHEEHILHNLLGWRPAGVVVSGVDHSPRTRQLLLDLARPVVEIMDLAEQPLDLNVGLDHAAVGTAVAEDLVRRGRRQIAYIGTVTRKDHYSGRRINAFQRALKAAGLPTHLMARSDKPNSMAVGAELLRDLLQREPQVDAIFLATDDLAVGALVEAQRQGKRIPQDLAIMGYNDQDIATYISPALSTVRTPRVEIGHIAARMLLARLEGKTVDARRVDVGFQIIHRATT